jgi:predicted secreted protein
VSSTLLLSGVCVGAAGQQGTAAGPASSRTGQHTEESARLAEVLDVVWLLDCSSVIGSGNESWVYSSRTHGVSSERYQRSAWRSQLVG